jgi:hypothetical protein
MKRPMVPLLSMWCCLCIVLCLHGCGGDRVTSPSPTPPPPKANIKVLMDPSPIVAVPSGDPTYPWGFAVNIQVSDSGGVAFIVTSMQTTVTAASTGLSTSFSNNPFVGVKIPAYGQETRQFHWPSYRMDAEGTKEGTFNVKMNFVDDAGNASVFDGTVKIQHAAAPLYGDP